MELMLMISKLWFNLFRGILLFSFPDLANERTAADDHDQDDGGRTK